jgi:hypothetical protein
MQPKFIANRDVRAFDSSFLLSRAKASGFDRSMKSAKRKPSYTHGRP